jgi:hypothetical protein
MKSWSRSDWEKAGIFTLFMYVFNTFLMPPAFGDPIELRMILLGIPAWIIGGIGIVWLEKRFPVQKK